MDSVIQNFKQSSLFAIEQVQEELKGIRTGRANPGMIENITIEAYGGSTKMKLKELSAVTTEGSDTLVINPYDKSIIKDIEKGIFASPLGFNPSVQGSTIYIRIPPLTAEQRQKYTKLVSEYIENGRNMIRGERDEARKKIKRMENDKEITEDERYRAEKEIDDLTKEFNEKLQTLKEHKEKEVMNV